MDADPDDCINTLDDAVILASFIQEEAGMPEEDYKVSACFHNRLESAGMPLQSNASCDIMQDNDNNYLWNSPMAEYMGWTAAGEIPEEVLAAYDTYHHVTGLTAGAISNPASTPSRRRWSRIRNIWTRAISTSSPATPRATTPGQYFYAKTLTSTTRTWRRPAGNHPGTAAGSRACCAGLLPRGEACRPCRTKPARTHQKRSCTPCFHSRNCLARRGNLETLKYAVLYGADAVYCALKEFGMRAAPANFTPGELAEGCIFAHARGKKVYLTLNILAHQRGAGPPAPDHPGCPGRGRGRLHRGGPGRGGAVQKVCPRHRHPFFHPGGHRQLCGGQRGLPPGAKRVVLARELSLTEIAQIRDNTPPELELEAFVHGAMCMSVSGRCLLSSYLTGRSGNRGECAQPCRWKYYLVEERRPGQYMQIGETRTAATSSTPTTCAPRLH